MFAIVDMVSRRWIDTLVSIEETSTQVQVICEHAVETEGLLDLLTDARLDLDVDDPARPILLAVSDNGPPMAARDTRAFMTLQAIAQHHSRPPRRDPMSVERRREASTMSATAHYPDPNTSALIPGWESM
ncbi:MAG: hypothetical protein QM733_21260 [Ilumatobacteraceae bacterium]